MPNETPKRFKILMFGKIFVDPNLLEKGIYEAVTPVLYPYETTIEGKIEQGKMIKDMLGTQILNESYFENLQKCKLVDFYLQPEPEKSKAEPAQRTADFKQFLLNKEAGLVKAIGEKTFLAEKVYFAYEVIELLEEYRRSGLPSEKQ